MVLSRFFKMKVLSSFVVLLLTCKLWHGYVKAQVEDEEEMCLPFRRSTSRPLVGQGIQGRPGKLGPEGPPGPKGDQGELGQCGCDPSEVEQLDDKIRELNEITVQMNEKISYALSALPTDYFVNRCAVGLKDRKVPDADMQASTIYTHNHAAHQGRLDYVAPSALSSSWSARNNRLGEWIQVDLQSSTSVTGVITQGRGDSDQWVTSFKISYGNSTDELKVIRNENGEEKMFAGNSNRNTHVMNRFPQPVVARYFRLIVQSWHNHISLRMEYITC